MSYGKQHEKDAIFSYVQYQNGHGVDVMVVKCGLIVDEFESWPAASPDGIVTDPYQDEHKKGILEVKYLWQDVNSRCLQKSFSFLFGGAERSDVLV